MKPPLGRVVAVAGVVLVLALSLVFALGYQAELPSAPRLAQPGGGETQRWQSVTVEGAELFVPVHWSVTRASAPLPTCTDYGETQPSVVIWPEQDRPSCGWPEDPHTAPLTVHASSSLGSTDRGEAGTRVRSSGGVLGRGTVLDGIEYVDFPAVNLALTINSHSDLATARAIVDSVHAAADEGVDVQAGLLTLTLPSPWRVERRPPCADEVATFGQNRMVTVVDSGTESPNCLKDLTARSRPAVVVVHAADNAFRSTMPPGRRRVFVAGHTAFRADANDVAFYFVPELDAAFVAVMPDHPLLEAALLTAGASR